MACAISAYEVISGSMGRACARDAQAQGSIDSASSGQEFIWRQALIVKHGHHGMGELLMAPLVEVAKKAIGW
jgi:hypothetical protein